MSVKIDEAICKTILTAQNPDGGFLSNSPFPFTHTLSPYTGCSFGYTACGTYCYAQFLASWQHIKGDRPPPKWGSLVRVKMNAPDVLRDTLRKTKNRQALRIFFSTTVDPWQVPVEAEYKITQKCLEVFSDFDDIGLLVMQTRSPLAQRDVALMASIPYLWLSVTLETDNQAELSKLALGGPTIAARRSLVRDAAAAGIPTQIAVSPCLPHTTEFKKTLLRSGAQRIIVDDFIDGDGSRGNRTSNSPFAQKADYNWKEATAPKALYEALQSNTKDIAVTWSSSGFCSIPSREIEGNPTNTGQLSMF